MSERRDWGVQVFLNDPEGEHHGWLHGRVVHADRDSLPTMELAIGDCSRVVTLDFDLTATGPEATAAMRRKLRRLQAAVDDFVAHALVAVDEAERSTADGGSHGSPADDDLDTTRSSAAARRARSTTPASPRQGA